MGRQVLYHLCHLARPMKRHMIVSLVDDMEKLKLLYAANRNVP